MHAGQAAVNERWAAQGRPPFELGIGLSTGEVAAALLGSEERLEYTLVGDVVNLSQRLQDMARPGNATVVSDATWQALSEKPDGVSMGEFTVKGREGSLTAWRVEAT